MATVRELVTTWGFEIDEAPLKRMDQHVNTLKSTIRTIGFGAAAVGAAVGGLFLKNAGVYEQAQIAFETMLGDAERAKKLLQDITAFAAKTPFEVPGLIESGKRLLAFGFQAEEIIPTMESLGNIAAGVGADKLPLLILALGQVRAATKLRGQELRQFTEAGVPMLEELAKLKGVTTKEISELVSKGGVSYEDTEKALRNLTTGTGRFANLMLKQSASLFGMLSNLKDYFTMLFTEVGTEGLAAVKDLVAELTEWIQANREIIKANLVKFLRLAVAGLQQFFHLVKAIAPYWKQILTAFVAFQALKLSYSLSGIAFEVFNITKAFMALGNVAMIAQAKMMAIPLAIAAAVAAVGLIIEDIVAFFQGRDSVTGYIVGFIQEKFPLVTEAIGTAVQAVRFLAQAFKTVWLWMVRIADTANAAFKPIFAAFERWAGFLQNMFGMANRTAGKGMATNAGMLGKVLNMEKGWLTSGTDWLASLSPSTAPAPSGRTAVSKSTEIKPNVSVTVQGGMTNEQTGGAVADAITKVFEGFMAETSRDFAPAIER